MAAPSHDLPNWRVVFCIGEIRITQSLQRNQPDGFNGHRPKHAKDKRFGITEKLNLATWNVRSLSRKEAELCRELKNRNINIAIITETKKKFKGTKDLDGYVMIYSGVEGNKRASSGVAILIDHKWKTRIESYKYINERIVEVRFRISRGYLTIIGVYAPEEGKKEETDIFYETLQKVVNSYIKTDSLIISGDLNARIGNTPVPNIVGEHGETCINDNGHSLIHFATSNNMRITNSFFRKKDIHKYTWSARGTRSIIDYILANNKICRQVQDVHVYRGSDIYSDHYLVVAKIALLARWKTIKTAQIKNEEVFKVYLLQDESIRRLYQNRLNILLQQTETKDNIEMEWGNIKQCIKEAAAEALGRKKKIRSKKGLRIWNEEIANAIEEKKAAYHLYLQASTEENREVYKNKRNRAKDIVRRAHDESWTTFISKIEHDLHGGQAMAYKVMQHLSKSEKDTANINVIPEKRWLVHYRKLWFNEEQQLVDISREQDVAVYEGDSITIQELSDAMNRLKNRKAAGPDGVSGELLKYGGLILKLRLLHLFNMCWKSHDVPNAWKAAHVISIFKKGKRNDCNNYRGISLIDTAYKVYAKVIQQRLQNISENLLIEEQNGFRKGRSCTDNTFIVKQIIEKHREFNVQTHMAFIDFEKAFDRVDRNVLWRILEKRGYPQQLIKAVQSLYSNTRVAVKSNLKVSEEIPTNQGVRQGCPLSPALFNIYIDDIMRRWRTLAAKGFRISGDTFLNMILFADDLLIIQNTEDDLQQSVYKLGIVCEEYNMRISVAKTKVMAFQGPEPIRTKIVVNNKPVEQVKHFNYLGNDISYDRDKDINNKLHKYQIMCGIINRTLKNKVRTETKMKFYKVVAAPVLLYGSETWTTTAKDESRIQASEMKFLRQVKGCTRRDRIRNDAIREELSIYNMNVKLKEYRGKWKEHLQRMDDSRLPKKIFAYEPKGKRSLGRPRKRWLETSH